MILLLMIFGFPLLLFLILHFKLQRVVWFMVALSVVLLVVFMFTDKFRESECYRQWIKDSGGWPFKSQALANEKLGQCIED